MRFSRASSLWSRLLLSLVASLLVGAMSACGAVGPQDDDDDVPHGEPGYVSGYDITTADTAGGYAVWTYHVHKEPHPDKDITVRLNDTKAPIEIDAITYCKWLHKHPKGLAEAAQKVYDEGRDTSIVAYIANPDGREFKGCPQVACYNPTSRRYQICAP